VERVVRESEHWVVVEKLAMGAAVAELFAEGGKGASRR
jgi:hypothetical protein